MYAYGLRQLRTLQDERIRLVSTRDHAWQEWSPQGHHVPSATRQRLLSCCGSDFVVNVAVSGQIAWTSELPSSITAQDGSDLVNRRAASAAWHGSPKMMQFDIVWLAARRVGTHGRNKHSTFGKSGVARQHIVCSHRCLDHRGVAYVPVPC
jgi:hypothetical protein